MQTVSAGFLAAIRGPHRLAVKAVVTSADGTASAEVPIEDGTIQIDPTAEHRRQLDLTISDPALYPDTASSVVEVVGAEIQVWRGITFADGSEELVSLGIFRIQDASRTTPSGGLEITGWDRSIQIADERFIKPRVFDKMRATALIQQLITEVYPDAVFDVRTTDTTKIGRHHVARDRWEEVLKAAQAISCEVYPDADGVWVIADIPDPTTAEPVWSTDAGPGGVLISLTDTVSRDSVYNAVVVTSDGPPTVFVADAFNRTSGSGWGTSGSGDDWTPISGVAGDFDTDSGRGRIQAAAGDTKRIQADASDDADGNATGTIRFPSAITGDDIQASLALRTNAAGTTCVRINLTYRQSDGHIIARPQTVVAGSVTDLGSADKDLGHYSAGDDINVSIRVKGTSAKAKAWLSNEPNGWDWNTTQSSVNAAGDVQCRLNRSAGNTNSGSPQVTFDDVKVTATGPWYSVAHDDDANSPTYWGGAYGHNPAFVTNRHLRSQAQADHLAARLLAAHLGEARTISFTQVPNPALDAEDCVIVVRPDGSQEAHILDAVTIGLGPNGVMTGTTRVKEWTAAQ